ncbi:SRPBCC family protein [Virgibacillus xinjiangensis]|uniref:SRPBCC family protein n=1 Tax=Virgibacillus xinjiangensis TaxID=393090 RepID=A0ABV7CVM1_9BACI
MKKWTKRIDISAPMEKVWNLFDGELEDMQKIMPQVIDHQPISITDERTGSVYLQKYKEGKRVEEYEVETLEYVDRTDAKKLKIGFTLAGMFEVTACYELEKIRDGSTTLIYTVTNRPLKWFAKVFLLFATDKVVDDFMVRVKTVAELENNKAAL